MATADSSGAVAPREQLPTATLNVAFELAALRRMTPKELRQKYADVFGEPSRSGHKEWLVKRIIWRMQANAEGDLSERARRRALEIANDADLRVRAPRVPRQSTPQSVTGQLPRPANNRLPMPGSVITRQYKGQLLQVIVLNSGFEFEGERFRTLSALAKKITGSHVNGYQFFHLGQYGGDR